jgi:hypothetical protein
MITGTKSEFKGMAELRLSLFFLEGKSNLRYSLLLVRWGFSRRLLKQLGELGNEPLQRFVMVPVILDLRS